MEGDSVSRLSRSFCRILGGLLGIVGDTTYSFWGLLGIPLILLEGGCDKDRKFLYWDDSVRSCNGHAKECNMARLARAKIFDPAEIVAVHLIGKKIRSCYLMGGDEHSGKNFDNRKHWLEEKFKHCAANFGIDLLAFSCLSNYFPLLLRSRPDIVATWNAALVAVVPNQKG